MLRSNLEEETYFIVTLALSNDSFTTQFRTLLVVAVMTFIFRREPFNYKGGNRLCGLYFLTTFLLIMLIRCFDFCFLVIILELIALLLIAVATFRGKKA